jgi:hypothetical protein
MEKMSLMTIWSSFCSSELYVAVCYKLLSSFPAVSISWMRVLCNYNFHKEPCWTQEYWQSFTLFPSSSTAERC